MGYDATSSTKFRQTLERDDRSHRIRGQRSVTLCIRHACTRTHVRTSNFNVPRHGQCNHVVCLPVLSFGHRRWAYSRLQSRPRVRSLWFCSSICHWWGFFEFSADQGQTIPTRDEQTRPSIDLHIEVSADRSIVDNCEVSGCCLGLVVGVCLSFEWYVNWNRWILGGESVFLSMQTQNNVSRSKLDYLFNLIKLELLYPFTQKYFSGCFISFLSFHFSNCLV